MTGPTAGASGDASLAVTVDVLSAALVTLYADAETQLIQTMGRLASDAVRDTSKALQAALYSEMRRAAQRISAALTLRAQPLTSQIIAEAAQRGDTAALTMLRQAVEGDPALAKLYLSRIGDVSGHGAAAANAIALELADALNATRTGILRSADDAYRAAVADAATRLVLGRDRLTPVTAQNMAWRRLMQQGLPGIIDQRGRRWNLASYVEMATRSAVQRAYNQSHLNRMTSLGIRYFTISHDGHPCPLCRPWEGAVLSSGRVGTVVDSDAATGQPVAFTVTGTLDQARAAGLQHPNCKHVLLPYFPGVTKTKAPEPWSDADAAKYQATEQLRYYERQIRKAKLQVTAAVALRDEGAYGNARAKIRRYDVQIRDHVDRHGLVRRPRRERPNLGNKR